MMSEIPEEPEKPLYSDCCGGGSCCPCVWDDYYDKLDKWRDAIKAQESKEEAKKASPSE